MILPIRCFSCGKPIAQLWEEFQERIAKGEDAGKAMTALGLERYCCRRMFISNSEHIEQIIQLKGR